MDEEEGQCHGFEEEDGEESRYNYGFEVLLEKSGVLGFRMNSLI